MGKRTTLFVSVFIIGGLIAGSMMNAGKVDASVPGINILASPHVSGTWTDGTSRVTSTQSLSGDGRYVVFSSDATNLVSNDSNGLEDVFVRDTVNNTTVMVSVATGGATSNGRSDTPSISYDGRFVVFTSLADTLASGVTGTSTPHIYIRDIANQTTSLVDTSASGTIGSSWALTASVSADGRFVVFGSKSSNLVSGFSTGNKYQVFIKDMVNGAIKPLSVTSSGAAANGDNVWPSMSCDGNVVSFHSKATNIAGGSGGTPTSRDDVIIAELGWAQTVLTSITAHTEWGVTGTHQVSCNGNVVAFTSQSTNVITPNTAFGYVNAYLYDRLSKTHKLVSLHNNNIPGHGFSSGQGMKVSVSGDGRFVAFTTKANSLGDTAYPTNSDPAYTHPAFDTYIRDIRNAATYVASTTALDYRSGRINYGANGVISADGSSVAFGYLTPGSDKPGGEAISGVNTGIVNGGQYDIYVARTGL